jgi:hypothetical protein
MLPRVHNMEVSVCCTKPQTGKYHTIPSKPWPKGFSGWWAPKDLQKEHCKTIGKSELQTHMTGQGIRPFQTLVYSLDMIALQNIYITYDYFHILTAHSMIDKRRWISTICWDALLFLQHLKTKGTGRQELKWLNDAVNICAIWI